MAKILLVDDDPEVAGLMSDWLRLRGYDVLRAGDGLEALRIARSDTPDLILLDAFMPGLDGLETGRRLRAQPETRHMPIVLIAGEDAASAQVDRLMAGASDAVTRPVALEDLGQRMRILLDGGDIPDDRADTLARGAVAAAVTGLPCALAWLFGPDPDGGWSSLAAAAPGRPDVLPSSRASVAIAADDLTGWLGSPLHTRIAEFNIPMSQIQAPEGDAVLDACLRLSAAFISLIPLASSGSHSAVGLLLLASRGEIDTTQESIRRGLLAATNQAGLALEVGDFTPGLAALTVESSEDLTEAEPPAPEHIRFEALREATLAALTGTSLDMSLQVIISQVARALNARLTAVLLRPQREGDSLTIHRAAGLRASRLEDSNVPLAGSLAGEALQAGRPVVYRPGMGARAEIALIEELTGAPVTMTAAAPLVVRGEPAGALLAANLREGQFGPEESNLLQSLANLASITIGGARVDADTEGRARGLSVLHRAAHASSAQPVPALFDSITRLVLDGLDVKSCVIRGWDARHNQMVTLARRTDHRRMNSHPRTVNLAGWPPARQAIEAGAVVRVSGNRQETRGGLGMHSLMLYPMSAGLLAVMGHPAENQVYTEEHVSACRDAAEDWAAMQPPGTDLAGAAGGLADSLLDAVEAPWCTIYAVDAERKTLTRAAEVGHMAFGLTGPESIAVGVDSLRRAIIGRRKTIAFGSHDERLTADDLAAGSPFEAGQTLATAIQYFGKPVGLIEALDDSEARIFADHDRLILQAVASLVGAALGRVHINAPVAQPPRPDTELAAPLPLSVTSASAAPLDRPDTEEIEAPAFDMPARVEPAAHTVPESSAEGEGLPLRQTMASLENVARIAFEALRPDADQATVTLLSFFGEFLPDIYIDRERILLVFKTLLQNAITFSPHGGRVTLTLRQVGQMLNVEIADHGIGIPLEEQGKIWDIGLAPTPDGLHGLALAAEIIKAHNGRIWLVSQPNIGSTFAFSLPTSELSGMGDFIPSF